MLDITTDVRMLDITTDVRMLDITTDIRMLDITTDVRMLDITTDVCEDVRHHHDVTIGHMSDQITNTSVCPQGVRNRCQEITYI